LAAAQSKRSVELSSMISLELEARVGRVIVHRSHELADHAGVATNARQRDRSLLDGVA